MANPDDDAPITTGETLREAKARGAKQTSHAKKHHAQERGSALTHLGVTWSQVRRDWETGAFTLRGLANAHGLVKSTLIYRMQKEKWGDRPLGPAVSAALPGFVHELSPKDASVEQVLAAIEGRVPDGDIIHAEQAASVAQRKAVILRGHRMMATELRQLYAKSVKLLSDYMEGRQENAFVISKNERGEKIHLPLRLISAQHGLMDGLDKAARIAERVISVERLANALEGVDGDGNPLKALGSSVNPLSHLTEEEILERTKALEASLVVPGRLTPVPSGLELSFRV